MTPVAIACVSVSAFLFGLIWGHYLASRGVAVLRHRQGVREVEQLGIRPVMDSMLIREFAEYAESTEVASIRRPLLNRVLNALEFCAARAVTGATPQKPALLPPENHSPSPKTSGSR